MQLYLLLLGSTVRRNYVCNWVCVRHGLSCTKAQGRYHMAWTCGKAGKVYFLRINSLSVNYEYRKEEFCLCTFTCQYLFNIFIINCLLQINRSWAFHHCKNIFLSGRQIIFKMVTPKLQKYLWRKQMIFSSTLFVNKTRTNFHNFLRLTLMQAYLVPR